MENVYLRGEIYYADLSPVVGCEQNGKRPVLIIQNQVGNIYSPTLIVAPITSKTEVKAHLPTHCLLNTTNGVLLPSVVLLEQIRTIDKRRLINFIGEVNANQMNEVNRAIEISLGLDIKLKSFE